VSVYLEPFESALDVVSLLVSYGARIGGLIGLSPLWYAVSRNSPSMVSPLLSSRLEFPDIVSEALLENNALLHDTMHYGHVDCCRLLIDAGADVNAISGELK